MADLPESRTVSVRLTPEEARLLAEELERDGCSPSEHVRAALRDYWLRPRPERRRQAAGE